MSHITEMDVELRDLTSIRAACKRLGWEFVEGQSTYRWFGVFVGDSPLPEGVTVEDLGKCDHAIRVPGIEYEVGVVRKGNAWTLRWDFWDRGLLRKMGDPKGSVFAQAYGIEHTKRMLRREGYRNIRESLTENGDVKLTVGGAR